MALRMTKNDAGTTQEKKKDNYVVLIYFIPCRYFDRRAILTYRPEIKKTLLIINQSLKELVIKLSLKMGSV